VNKKMTNLELDIHELSEQNYNKIRMMGWLNPTHHPNFERSFLLNVFEN